MGEESSPEDAFIPMNNLLKFYGYKVNSQLGMRVHHLTKPSGDEMVSDTRHHISCSLTSITTAHWMKKQNLCHLSRSHMRDGRADCDLSPSAHK